MGVFIILLFSFLVGLKYSKETEQGEGHCPWYITGCVFKVICNSSLNLDMQIIFERQRKLIKRGCF